ncbi:DUF2844 domain-containing protein [Paraburkholderia phenoliruptrix]|uniref:DUF2844 domain-containing protein n=1 Tax=Paraburkholderia phenoliruptrix TaxID=252970 RepID=UPI001C6E0C97|nr:DUF2844 domain-containing protein [Paraburkholderia phenoliruptrix]MBW9105210.1 DUF2844 domain-containing protein [Paraburkholderia phenoliruptrix]MBW9129856.1 DUF2844 domain-containing protein [Paraburkholderia ginsengiterrae]
MTFLKAASAAALMLPLASYAALGGAPGVGAPSQTSLRSAAAVTTPNGSASYRLHETRDVSGVAIREYTLPNNVVFAVAWQGPVRPDMNALLGNYFHRAATAGADKPRGTGPFIERSDDFQIESMGRPGNFFGKAILPRLLPANVRAQDIR